MKCQPKAKNNREAVVVCARYVVKRPSKRSVLVVINSLFDNWGISCFYLELLIETFIGLPNVASWKSSLLQLNLLFSD